MGDLDSRPCVGLPQASLELPLQGVGVLKNLGLAWCSGGFDSLPRPQITKKNKVMRIRISDKSLRDGELTLEVSNFLTTSQEMFFDLDNRWLGDFNVVGISTLLYP